MRNPVLLLLALAACAGITVWLATEDTDEPAPAEPTGRPAELLPQPDATGEAERDPPEPAHPVEPEPVDEPGKIITEQFREPEPEETVPVEVVQRRDGELRPAAGAEVWFLAGDQETMARLQRRVRVEGMTIHEAVGSEGRLFRTDAEGRTRVPRDPPGGVIAFAPGHMGDAEIRARDGTVRVVLRRVDALRVRVVDPEDEPVAGVPVAVYDSPEAPFPRSMSVTTGDDGLATVLMRRRPGRRPLDPGASGGRARKARLVARVPLADPVEVPLDPDTIPADPVILVLPPTGTLVVSVEDAAGTPVPAGTVVARRAGDVPAMPGWPRVPPTMAEHRAAWTRPITDGAARFPHVGTGVRLDLEARAGHGLEAEARDVPGPEAGGTAEVLLRAVPRRPVVSFRIVDGEGRPRAGLRGRSRLRTGQSSTGTPFVTDEDGRGQVDVQSGWAPETERWLALARTDEHGRDDLDACRRIDLSRRLPAGVTDLGDLELRPAPLLCEGRVLDGAGRPLAGVELRLQKQPSPPPGLPEELPEGARRFYKRWRPVNHSSATTGTDGRFTIRSLETRDTRLRLTAEQEGWFQEERVVFRPGARGLHVVLQEGGAITARVLLPPLVDPHSLHALIEQDSGAAPFDSRSQSLRKGGFTATGIPPGTYRLRFRSHALVNNVVKEIPGIRVNGPGPVEDPRLDPVDLRREIRATEVFVVDPEGNPVTGAAVLVFQNGAATGGGVDGDGRRVALHKPGSDVRLEVRAPGFQKAVVRDGGRHHRVVLEPLLHLVLEVPDAVLQEIEPFRLRARLVATDSGEQVMVGAPDNEVTVEDGRARVPVPGAGSWKVQWTIVPGPPAFPIARASFSADPPQLIEVREGDSERVIRARIPSEALGSAREKLRRELERFHEDPNDR